MTDDAELLRRYAGKGDEGAFAELVRRHLGFVYHAALRQCGGDAHRAEDVAQAVFTDLARKAAKLARRPVLAGWLYTSTRYAAAQAVRGEARRQAREQEAHAMSEILSDNNAGPAAEWERLRPVIDDALQALAERDREAVLLRFFEGRPFAEVGAKLFLSEDAARMRVERALDKMRAVLARRGMTSTSAALAAVLANQAAATAPVGLAASVTGAALASADLTAASALSFLQFMSTTKFTVSAAAIIGFLALGTAGYKVHARHKAEASLAAAQGNYTALVARLRGLEQRAAATEQRAAELQQNVNAAQAQAAADAAAKAWKPVAEGKAFLQRHPEVVQAMIGQKYAYTRVWYGSLFKSLNLTPAQIEEFLPLVRGRWFFPAAVTVDGGKAMLSIETEAMLSESEVQNRLRALLGDEGYRQLQNHAPIKDGRQYTSRLAGGLCFTETPLTPQQADQLVQIMSANIEQAGKLDWDVIDAKARGVLSAAQLPEWETLLAERRTQQALAMAEAPSPNPTPAKHNPTL